MNDSTLMINFKKELRVRQDCGLLPCETGQRFQVMVAEIGAPVFRALVTTLCIEGLSVRLLMALDETPPYVGIEIADPHTFLCLWPGHGNHEFLSNLQAGDHMGSISARSLNYRRLTTESMEQIVVEQLRLVLCPTAPIP